MTKIFAVAMLSIFVFCVLGCEETYEKSEKDDEPTVQSDEDLEETESDSDHDEIPENTTEEIPEEVPEENSEETPEETSETDPCLAPDAEKINSVVIGTYNTRLFFDKHCDSGYCSDSDFEKELSDSEYKNKVADLADSVKEIGADIILLQEVEKESCLKDLFEKSGDYDDSFLGEKGTPSSVDTGVMTKGEITYKN